MESIQKEITLADRVRSLENRAKFSERKLETKKKKKTFRWPFKWQRKFNKAKRIKDDSTILVIFFNKKNQIEPPKFLPIFDGNMIVYKNKPYEFDPRAVWTIVGVKGNPQAYAIKEIDRRPVMNKNGKVVYRSAEVTNMDIDKIRERGDSTESDEFLIKAALRAQTAKAKKPMSKAVMIIIGIIVVGGLIWLLTS
jgi:hypothetical protein